MNSSLPYIFVFLLLVCAPGCSNRQKETAYVRGRVTLDGRPLASGGVNFVPVAGRGAGGTIAADGTYVLGTYTKSDGAIVGMHKVAVCPPFRGEDDPELTPEEMAIPQRYLNSESSGLEFEVKAGQENVLDIELTSNR